MLSSAVEDPSTVHDLIRYIDIDRTITPMNPAVLPHGSNVSDAPLPKTNPHVCNKPYCEVEDHYQDLNDLIATEHMMVYRVVGLDIPRIFSHSDK